MCSAGGLHAGVLVAARRVLQRTLSHGSVQVGVTFFALFPYASHGRTLLVASSMAPPPPVVIDAQAVSGITGSILIACWIIVFMPQIYENFVRKLSEGLSLTFIVLWLAGDVFNVLGAVLQHVLPTMIVLAVYYTLADVVLLWQCLAYGLHIVGLDHLLPATPLNEDVLENVILREEPELYVNDDDTAAAYPDAKAPPLRLRTFLLNLLMVGLVVMSGLVGWALTYHPNKPHKHPTDLVFDPLAQFFGWLCAALYLGSRVPQIVLNYRRQLCDGISFMFFLFACLGNLTYLVLILCISTEWDYLVINSLWLAGSLGTLALDGTIFVQFFLYAENDDEWSEASSERTPLV